MYWNTTSPLLQSVLRTLMACELFDAFRLVGGILQKLTDFTNADDDFEPQCLNGKYWEIIKLDIIEALE